MGSLGKLTTLEPDDLETGMQKLDVMPGAISEVERRGLRFPVTPDSGFKGEMPKNLTELDDEELGDLLNNVSQWCGFVEKELAKARGDRDEALTKLEFIQARIRIALKSDEPTGKKRLTDKDKNDLQATDPRVVDAKGKVLYTEAVFQLTRTIFNQAERGWETVSRRITQRGQAIERMKRETSVAGIQNPNQSQGRFRRPSGDR